MLTGTDYKDLVTQMHTMRQLCHQSAGIPATTHLSTDYSWAWTQLVEPTCRRAYVYRTHDTGTGHMRCSAAC